MAITGLRAHRIPEDARAARRLFRAMIAAGPVIEGAEEGRALGETFIDEFTRHRVTSAEVARNPLVQPNIVHMKLVAPYETGRRDMAEILARLAGKASRT